MFPKTAFVSTPVFLLLLSLSKIPWVPGRLCRKKHLPKRPSGRQTGGGHGVRAGGPGQRHCAGPKAQVESRCFPFGDVFLFSFFFF